MRCCSRWWVARVVEVARSRTARTVLGPLTFEHRACQTKVQSIEALASAWTVMRGYLNSKTVRSNTHFFHLRTSLSKRFEEHRSRPPPGLHGTATALVHGAEGAEAGADVTGEELPEVGGVGKAQTAGDGRHRLIRVRRQPLQLQRDTGIDHTLRRLFGGNGGGHGQGLDRVTQTVRVVGSRRASGPAPVPPFACSSRGT
jgi:hypothetical protein